MGPSKPSKSDRVLLALDCHLPRSTLESHLASFQDESYSATVGALEWPKQSLAATLSHRILHSLQGDEIRDFSYGFNLASIRHMNLSASAVQQALTRNNPDLTLLAGLALGFELWTSGCRFKVRDDLPVRYSREPSIAGYVALCTEWAIEVVHFVTARPIFLAYFTRTASIGVTQLVKWIQRTEEDQPLIARAIAELEILAAQPILAKPTVDEAIFLGDEIRRHCLRQELAKLGGSDLKDLVASQFKDL